MLNDVANDVLVLRVRVELWVLVAACGASLFFHEVLEVVDVFLAYHLLVLGALCSVMVLKLDMITVEVLNQPDVGAPRRLRNLLLNIWVHLRSVEPSRIRFIT